MPRPKGSKNKKTSAAGMTMEQIAAAKITAAEEIEALEAAVGEAAQELKNKKAELRAAQRRLVALEKQEAAAAVAAAMEARKAEAEKLAAAFMESDKTLDEILEAFNQ